MNEVNRKWYSGMAHTEDWWAVWLGLLMFGVGLLSIWGYDLVGWQLKTATWIEPGKWGVPSSKAYAGLGWFGSFVTTYVVWTVATSVGAYFMRLDVKKYIIGWTVVYVLGWTCWIIGNYAYIAAPVNQFKKFGITWGLSLGGDTGFIIALLVGLVIGNFFKPFAAFIKEACKPEWFIKTAIVYLGIKLGTMSIDSVAAKGFAIELGLAGAAATFVAYLLFWPLIYTLGRRVFRLPREWAAVFCSGISICGVSASIATAGAIRAKPIIPALVSTLVVVYAMIELVVLPGFYTAVAPDQPIVNGAAMGMTVKTDGADAAAGAILDQLMVAQAAGKGVMWQKDWILTAALMTKVWIDIFIGVWAFLLALLWVYKVERQPGQTHVPVSEVWFRFPKFVLGYLFCWFSVIAIASIWPEVVKDLKVGASSVQSPMRSMFFAMTFVSLGVLSDFSKLKGLGRMALLYGVSLIFIIAPIAYLVAWIFHNGMMPPLVGS
ncbi:putative sulfate exporter family transporter [Shumkonia mesophila]|uniref:putative sulfate exporter family transporter n=1 Tax=Shumkonia mesophila TaxID=2838854 RepID=UPI002935117B|nr:putative sulfate exporter family transporter [Shumkonia mesophila]